MIDRLRDNRFPLADIRLSWCPQPGQRMRRGSPVLPRRGPVPKRSAKRSPSSKGSRTAPHSCRKSVVFATTTTRRAPTWAPPCRLFAGYPNRGWCSSREGETSVEATGRWPRCSREKGRAAGAHRRGGSRDRRSRRGQGRDGARRIDGRSGCARCCVGPSGRRRAPQPSVLELRHVPDYKDRGDVFVRAVHALSPKRTPAKGKKR